MKDAAEYAGISERTMRDLLKQGLKHSRLRSGTILIKFSDIDEYVEGLSVTHDEVKKIVDEIMAKMNSPRKK